MAVNMLTTSNISQLPVVNNEGEFVGSLTETGLLTRLIENPKLREQTVAEVMQKPFQFVPANSTLDVLSSMINRDNPAVMVRDSDNLPRIITQHDLLESIAG